MADYPERVQTSAICTARRMVTLALRASAVRLSVRYGTVYYHPSTVVWTPLRILLETTVGLVVKPV